MPPPPSTLFPYTTLFRSQSLRLLLEHAPDMRQSAALAAPVSTGDTEAASAALRSEEHTSELQSPYDLVCRLLLEKKKEVCDLQKALVNRRADDKIPDGLILVKHDPVATLGRRLMREDAPAAIYTLSLHDALPISEPAAPA